MLKLNSLKGSIIKSWDYETKRDGTSYYLLEFIIPLIGVYRFLHTLAGITNCLQGSWCRYNKVLWWHLKFHQLYKNRRSNMDDGIYCHIRTREQFVKNLARNPCSLVLQKSKLTEEILELTVLKLVTGIFFHSIY